MPNTIPIPNSSRERLFVLHARLCEEARVLMQKKNHDYASNGDPYRNFRTFGEMGFLVRLSDKLARLHSFIENGTLQVNDESVEDTVLDIINYAVLFRGYLNERDSQTMEGKGGQFLRPPSHACTSSGTHTGGLPLRDRAATTSALGSGNPGSHRYDPDGNSC